MTRTTSAIKNVDKDAWKLFKMEAARHDMAMGEFFSRLVKEHAMKEAGSTWEEILRFAGSISEKDAARMRKEAEALRRGLKMRTYATGH